MITFSKLGSLGRLGNQMFQYAALRGIAANNNEEWKIPPKNRIGTADYALFKCFKMSSVSDDNFIYDNINLPMKRSKGFEFDQNLFGNCHNADLVGYFQTEKYFLNVFEDIIRKDFEFQDDILEKAKKIVDKYNNPIFLHIRRGDNVGFPHLVNDPTFDYYERALNHFPKDCNVIICSDEIDWCKEQDFFKDERFVLSYDNEYYQHSCTLSFGGNPKPINSAIPFVDLCIMSLCNGGIIPTSTLSWWGGYLQKNRTNPIVVQDPWFGPELAKTNNTKDIIPDNWIKIRGK